MSISSGAVLSNGGSKPAVYMKGTAQRVYLTNTDINGYFPGTNATGIQFTNSSGDVFIENSKVAANGSGNTLTLPAGVNGWLDSTATLSGGAGLNVAGTLHHLESGTCAFAASTTCTITFAKTFGGSNPSLTITPINPGAITITLTALSATGATLTASGSTSISVGWSANL